MKLHGHAVPLWRRMCVQYVMGIVQLTRVACLSAACGALLLTTGIPAQMLGDPAARNTAPPPYAAVAPVAGALTFDAVMASAYSQSAFTFDRNMLQAADGFFAGSDPETRRVLAGLNSVTVRNYHARDFARYDTAALVAIDNQLRGEGWRHLVNANGHGNTNTTDLWLHFEAAGINNVTVLTRGDRNMSVITVDCILRPLDLLHLSGHFGIPKVDENAVMVPAH